MITVGESAHKQTCVDVRREVHDNLCAVMSASLVLHFDTFCCYRSAGTSCRSCSLEILQLLAARAACFPIWLSSLPLPLQCLSPSELNCLLHLVVRFHILIAPHSERRHKYGLHLTSVCLHVDVVVLRFSGQTPRRKEILSRTLLRLRRITCPQATF